MQRRVNCFGQFPADTRNCGQLVNPGIGDALQAAEMSNQGLAPLGSDTGDLVQSGSPSRLAALRPMA